MEMLTVTTLLTISFVVYLKITNESFAVNELKIALDWTPNVNHVGFFVAQEKGFLFCRKNREEAIDILSRQVPPSDVNVDLAKALEVTVEAFGTENGWGQIEDVKLQMFLDWLAKKGLEKQRFLAADINASCDLLM